MIIRKAYKYALKTKPEQARTLARFAGSCRFVWNRVLSIQKERLDRGEKVLRYVEAAALLPKWKKDPVTAWLAQAPTHPLQQSLRDLDRALRDAFDKKSPKRFPRFKKKNLADSFRYPDSKQFKIDQANSRIYLPKIGWVRYRNSRRIEGSPKNITVSKRAGRWFVSIQTEMEVEKPIHLSITAVGIDLGVVNFATLSNGGKVVPLSSFKKLEKKLARAQRSLVRKTKFSSNWKKQKTRIARLHSRIADARHDFLHKTSTAIAKSHGVVVLEDLQVKAMSASAKGTAETPGRNVRAKSGLNKSILDQGWGEFRRQIEYKQSWRGGHVWTVPPQNTSRRCNLCGHVSVDNRRTQARFKCVACGHSDHADVNAAKNILAAGLAVAACGGKVQSGRPVKQEPTEATQTPAA